MMKISILTEEPLGRRNHIVLILAPMFEEIDAARQMVDELCREYYSGANAQEQLGDLLLAITEAMNNVVEHGRTGLIEVELTAHPERVIFVIRSDGLPFDPTTEVAMPELDGADDLPEGGFGRALILELMDEVRYEFTDGKNVLKLTRNIVS